MKQTCLSIIISIKIVKKIGHVTLPNCSSDWNVRRTNQLVLSVNSIYCTGYPKYKLSSALLLGRIHWKKVCCNVCSCTFSSSTRSLLNVQQSAFFKQLQDIFFQIQVKKKNLRPRNTCLRTTSHTNINQKLSSGMYMSKVILSRAKTLGDQIT